jgi:aminoglycoside phosphotransferase (APT) family kinase protein
MTRILVEEIETWPEEWHKYVTKLRRMQENMVVLVHMMTRRNETGFNVLAHGDFWMNNIMFSEKGDSVRIVDFQLVNFTSPCIDLHYFLSTSASLDVRKNHTNTLLQVGCVLILP